MRKTAEFRWNEIVWPRPFEEDAARDLLIHLAAINRSGHITFELRAADGQVRYLFGAEKRDIHKLIEVFTTTMPDVRFETVEEHVQRKNVTTVRCIKLVRSTLSLKTNNTEAIVRALLAALSQTKHSGDETVVQIILGGAYTPSLLPDKLSDPAASWLDILRGSVGHASGETRRLMREKAECHGFNCVIRIGAFSADISRTHGYIRAVYSAMKTAEAAGARLKLAPDSTEALNSAKRSWHLPLRLSIRELPAFLGWPVGEAEYSGIAGLHPRIMLPPKGYYGGRNRNFGITTLGGIPLGIPARDSLYHTSFLGPTGAGKSNAMLSLIMADINAGRSIFVLDPKSDLVNAVLERVPESRADDVVIIDPSDRSPVGYNPLNSGKNTALTADAILAVFQDLFSDSWGIRTQDILSGTLMTLAKVKGATLIWLPALLTSEVFRRKVLKNISDPVGLDAFWAGFEAMSTAERNQAIAPVMNKIRQFLLRPELRAVLGQAEPKFKMTDIFHKRRIVLVPLNKGIIGHESAKLMGSLLIGQLWTLALGRAAISPEKRHIVNIYIDEVQDYLRLPGDLSDALSQARGLGIGLTLANQYRNQLPSNLRFAIDANVHNKIVFGLSASDAREMSTAAPELEPIDFMLLPRYAVYAHLHYNGSNIGWISGRTLPPTPALRTAAKLRARSKAAYGTDAKEVEREYLNTIGFNNRDDGTGFNESIGRRKQGDHE